MSGAALLVVGFSQAADFGWSDPTAYGVIIAGAVLLAAAITNCLFTKRVAVIPAASLAITCLKSTDHQRMFKIRTTLFFLLGSLIHALAFIPSNYLLPQLFQGVRGSSALMSGIELLPFSILVAVGTIIGELIIRTIPNNSGPDQLSSTNHPTCRVGGIRPGVSRIRPFVRSLPLSLFCRSARRSARHLRRGRRTIPLRSHAHSPSCHAAKGNGSDDECLGVDS